MSVKSITKHLKGDFFGGITAGVVALPLALAFGVQSGMGAAAGLYGAIFIGFFASLFGGTNTQISGPTAPMTAVSMVIIAGIIQVNEGDISAAIPSILMVFLLAGIFQIVLGIAGLGKYVRYIPYPVVSGFMTGIGVIIIVTQLLPMLGYFPKEDTQLVQQFKPEAEEVILEKILKDEAAEDLLVLEDFEETVRRANLITESEIQRESKTLAQAEASGVIGSLRYIPRALQNIKWLEFLIALVTIIVVYGFKRITSTIPSALVALLLVSGGAYFLGLDYRSIGDIPTGFPDVHLEMFTGFSIASVTPYIFTAITLAFLGAIDSLLTSIVADNLTKTSHNSDKELVGQGIGNSIAAVFGGIPGAGATIRTVVNIQAGGRTKLSGMIAALLLLVTLLVLSPVASVIPNAVLVGILITVGIGVMDYKGLRAIRSMPNSDVFIMLVVLILTATWNLVYAVGIGLVIGALVFMKKIGDLSAARSRVFQIDQEVWPDDMELPEELREEVYIKHINGPLFFGYAKEFSQLSLEVPATANYVVIRMSRVPYIDQSGVFTLEDVIKGYQSRGMKVYVTGLQDQPKRLLYSNGIIPKTLQEGHVYPSFHDCMVFLSKNASNIY
jgi:SulP family sulfate permease